MNSVQDRHDNIRPSIPVIRATITGPRGPWAGIAKDNRQFINGLFWTFSTGHRGLIYLKGMGDGAIASVDLLGGEIKVSGKKYWNN